MPKIMELGKEYDVSQNDYERITNARRRLKLFIVDFAWKKLMKISLSYERGDCSFNERQRAYDAFIYYFKDFK